MEKKSGQTGGGYVTFRGRRIANSLRALRQWKTRAPRVCHRLHQQRRVCSCGYVATSHVSRIRRSNENALLDQYGALSKLVRRTCEYNFNCGKWSRGLHIAVRCKRVSVDFNWNLKVKKMLEICLNQRDIFSSASSRNFYSFFETENSSSIPNCLSIKLQGVKGVKLVCGALRIFFFFKPEQTTICDGILKRYSCYHPLLSPSPSIRYD